MLKDADVLKLLKSILNQVDDENHLGCNEIGVLGVAFNMTQTLVKEKMVKTTDFETLIASVSFFAYTGSEVNSIIGFERGMALAKGDELLLYRLACAFYNIYIATTNKDHLKAYFVDAVTRHSDSDIADRIIKKMADRKMPL